jgi:iron(III) transport system substrate-binding protein
VNRQSFLFSKSQFFVFLERWCAGGLLLIFFFCTACSQKAPQLIIYSPHGKELLEDFASRFEQAHAGVNVEWLDMGSQNVLDRLRSEKANPQADIWWGAPAPMFMQAASEGLLEPYRPTWAEAVDSVYHDPQDRWYGIYLTPEVIVFNSQRLRREMAPQDWDELLEAKWRGRIVVREPMPSGTMRAIFFAMIYRFYQDNHSPISGFDWLRRLDANTKTYPADQTLFYLALSRGEGEVSIWNLPDIFLQHNRYGHPFDYVLPRSGVPIIPEGLALVARQRGADDNARTQLARQFYEFITIEEALILAANQYYRIPTRRDLDFSRIPPEFDPRQYTPMPMDWQLFADSSAVWMQYWDQRIRNRGRAAGSSNQ